MIIKKLKTNVYVDLQWEKAKPSVQHQLIFEWWFRHTKRAQSSILCHILWATNHLSVGEALLKNWCTFPYKNTHTPLSSGYWTLSKLDCRPLKWSNINWDRCCILNCVLLISTPPTAIILQFIIDWLCSLFRLQGTRYHRWPVSQSESELPLVPGQDQHHTQRSPGHATLIQCKFSRLSGTHCHPLTPPAYSIMTQLQGRNQNLVGRYIYVFVV